MFILLYLLNATKPDPTGIVKNLGVGTLLKYYKQEPKKKMKGWNLEGRGTRS